MKSMDDKLTKKTTVSIELLISLVMMAFAFGGLFMEVRNLKETTNIKFAQLEKKVDKIYDILIPELASK